MTTEIRVISNYLNETEVFNREVNKALSEGFTFVHGLTNFGIEADIIHITIEKDRLVALLSK